MARIFATLILLFLSLLSSNTFAARTKDFPVLEITHSTISNPLYLSPADGSRTITFTVTNKSPSGAHNITLHINTGLDTTLVSTTLHNDHCSGKTLLTLGAQCSFDITVLSTGSSGSTTLAPQACKSVDMICSIPAISNRITIVTSPNNEPTIQTITPSAGPATGNTPVTINGTDLHQASSVLFGTTAGTITGNTDTSISVTSPSHTPGPVTVSVVTTKGTATLPQGYTYNPIVTASAGTHGSLSPTGAVMVTYGGSQTFTATPSTGYVVSGWLFDGQAVCGTSASCALNNVTTNHTLTVSFAVQQLTVTPSGDGHETITPSTPQSVNYGSTKTFTVTPNNGYTVSTTVGGTCPTGSFSGTVYTTGTITGSCTVTFSATANTFTVTGAAGSGGSVSPVSASVAYNGSQTFTATPNTDYTVNSWSTSAGTLGGNCISGSNTCTLSNITQNATVTVTFTSSTTSVTATVNGGSCTATTLYPGPTTLTCTVLFTNTTNSQINNLTYPTSVVSGTGTVTLASGAGACNGTSPSDAYLNASGSCTVAFNFTPSSPTTVFQPTIEIGIASSGTPLAHVNQKILFQEPVTVQTGFPLTCSPTTVVAGGTSNCNFNLSNAGTGGLYDATLTPSTTHGTTSSIPATLLASGSNSFNFTFTAPSSIAGGAESDTVAVGYSDPNWATSVSISPVNLSIISAFTISGIRCSPNPVEATGTLNCNVLIGNVTTQTQNTPQITATIGGVATTPTYCASGIAPNSVCEVDFSAIPPTGSSVVVNVSPQTTGDFPSESSTFSFYADTTPKIQSNPLTCDSTTFALGGGSTQCSILFRALSTGTNATNVSLSPHAVSGSISNPSIACNAPPASGGTSCTSGSCTIASDGTCTLSFTYSPPITGPSQFFDTISATYSDQENSYPAFLYPLSVAIGSTETDIVGSVIPNSLNKFPDTHIPYSSDGSTPDSPSQVLFNFINQSPSTITFETPKVVGLVNGEVRDFSYAINTNIANSSCLTGSLVATAGCNLEVDFTPFAFDGLKTGDQIQLMAWLPIISPMEGISQIATWNFTIGGAIFTDVITSQLFVNEADSFTGAFLFGNNTNADITDVNHVRQFLPEGFSIDRSGSCLSLLTAYESYPLKACDALTDQKLVSETYCYACFEKDPGYNETATSLSLSAQLAGNETVVTAEKPVAVAPAYREITLVNNCPAGTTNPTTGEPSGTIWPAFVKGAAYYFCSQDSDCPLGTSCYTPGHQCQVIPYQTSACGSTQQGYNVPADFEGGGCSHGCNPSSGVASACPTYSTCDQATGLCYWNLPQPTASFPEGALTPGASVVMQIPNAPLTKAGDWSTVWSGGLVPRTGCHVVTNEQTGASILACDSGYCPVVNAGTDNSCTAGPQPPATQAEFTFLYNNQDYYDVEIINGINIPVSMKPTSLTSALDPSSPYTCNVTGEHISGENQCNWNFDMHTYSLTDNTTPTEYSVGNVALHTLVSPQEIGPYNPEHPDYGYGYSCTPDTPDPCASISGTSAGEICGLSNAESIGITGSSVTFKCGLPVGIWASNQLCGNSPNMTYDDGHGYTLNCAEDYEGNTLSTWFGCNGGTAQNSCYSASATTGCCGCPYWSAGAKQDQTFPTINSINIGPNLISLFANGFVLSPNANLDYCQSYTSSWITQVYEPSIIWMKQGCSSLYTFPYDDATSTFTCSSNSLSNGQVQNPAGKVNAQNYTITFCPSGNGASITNTAGGTSIMIP